MQARGAGLGLHLDRYRYLVGDRASGPRDAAMSLHCDVRGLREPPRAALPPIAERVGIDRSPLDPRDPAARSWLEACAPPEADGLVRLAAAMEVARRNPARLVAGDVLTALPAALDSFPPGRRVIVTDAYLAVFLAPPQRAELAAILARAGRTRPVTWLSSIRWSRSGRPVTTACRAFRCPPRWSATTSATGCSRCWAPGRSTVGLTTGTLATGTPATGIPIARACWSGPTRRVNGSNGSINGAAGISRSRRCPGRRA